MDYILYIGSELTNCFYFSHELCEFHFAFLCAKKFEMKFEYLVAHRREGRTTFTAITIGIKNFSV